MYKSSKIIKFHLASFTVLFFVGLLVFKNFFEFSLWGDDWMLSFYILEHRVAGTIPRLYFSLYGGQAILMDLMNKFFNFEPKYYFYTSYILRFIAATSIYILTYYISRKKTAAFFAGALFLTSFTGIESTNWVHNSINYLSLAIFLFGFMFWLKHQKEDKNKTISKNMLFCLCLFTLAIILAAVRMHGLIPFFILIEIYCVITNTSKLKASLLRILLLLGIFGSLSALGLFGSVGSYTLGMLKTNLIAYIQRDPLNIYRLILIPLGSFANIFFPTTYFATNSFYQEFLVNVSFGVYEAIFFSLPVIIVNILLFKKRWKVNIFLLFLWFLTLLLFTKTFGTTLDNIGSQVLLGIILIYFFISLYVYLFLNKKNRQEDIVFYFLAMAFSFIIITHALLINESTIEPYSRYMTISSGSSAILISFFLFSTISTKYKKSFRNYFVVIFSLILVFFNLKGVWYFFKISPFRLDEKVRPAWESINLYGAKIPYQGRIRLFIFDFNDKERDFYQTAIGFGGTYRFALENGIDNRQHLVVFLSKDELGVVLEAFRDPTVGVRYWGPVIKDQLKLSDIHGFILENGVVRPADAEIRQKILDLIKSTQPQSF